MDGRAARRHRPDERDDGDRMSSDRLYFRQLLAGRDFARGSRLARQMVNFSYLVGDRDTGQAVVVDPAYSVSELLGVLDEDGMTLTGVLATHFHPDHVGGGLLGVGIEGIHRLLDLREVPVHVQREDARWLRRVTGVSDDVLVKHSGGDVVQVGAVPIELIHTPGHTPGSQCFLVAGRLVSGDTLFLDGCGRTDLPGGDAEAMYDSLFGRLSRVPDGTVLFPGHRYSPAPSATMGETRRLNAVLAPRTAEQWLRLFGH